MEHHVNYKDFEQAAGWAHTRLLPYLRGSYRQGDFRGRPWPSELGWPIRPDSFDPHRGRSGKLSIVFAALLLAISGAAQAKNITAASPSLADVRSAIAAAGNNDTVIVPAGTASW